MNRFDNGSVSAYTPQSMQELAFTPMLKRTQHDEMSKNLAELDAIATDPLDVHQKEALRIKQEFEGKLGNLSGSLAEKGIDGVGKSDFYKLKKERDNLIAPTGRIGQINNAKKVYAEEFKDYLEDATKNKGFSREDALYNWQTQHVPKYTGYNDSKEIKNIDSYGAPKRLILQEDLKTVKSLLGENTQTIMKNNGFDFGAGPNGSIIVKDGKGRVVETTNMPQLKEAVQYLNSRWIQPTGEGTQSAKFERQDPNRIISEINNGLGMMKSYKLDDTTETDYSIQGYAAKDPTAVDPSGVIISNDSTLTSDALDKNNYQEVIKSINTLQSSKSLSPIEKSKLEDLKELKNISDSKISKDPKYIKTYNEYKNELNKWKILSNKMDLSDDEKRIIKENPNILPQLLFTKGIGSFKGNKNDKDLNLILDNNSLSKFSNLKKDKESIQNKYWKESSSLRHNYSYMPSTPKEEGVWNLHNENVYNTLKGIPDLNNVLDLTSVHTTGGTNKNITPEDVSNIQTLLKNGDSKSFKINNVKTYGDNKTPEVTMTFNTNEDAPEFDSKGVKWNDEYGGSKKPVTVTFKLKKFSNSFDTGSAAGYKNLTGAIANFWKDKGGINEITGNFQGAEVYNSMIENAYSNISDKELYARAQSDADAREALLIRVAKHQAKKQ